MGLKRDGRPTLGRGDQTPEQPRQQSTRVEKPTAKEPAVRTATTEGGGEQVLLLAVKTHIGDPITCIRYSVNQPMPGIRKEGNWVDCQIKAGVLKLTEAAPVDPADEK
jgi:hypothetical protein